MKRALHAYLPSYNSRYHTDTALSTMNAPSPALGDLLAVPSAPLERVFVPPHNAAKEGRLRQALKEAWDAEELQELVRSMRERCHAVIDAKGMHTKF